MATAAEVGIDTGHDTLVIDPVKMNITNRVAEGTILAG